MWSFLWNALSNLTNKPNENKNVSLNSFATPLPILDKLAILYQISTRMFIIRNSKYGREISRSIDHRIQLLFFVWNFI